MAIYVPLGRGFRGDLRSPLTTGGGSNLRSPKGGWGVPIFFSVFHEKPLFSFTFQRSFREGTRGGGTHANPLIFPQPASPSRDICPACPPRSRKSEKKAHLLDSMCLKTSQASAIYLYSNKDKSREHLMVQARWSDQELRPDFPIGSCSRCISCPAPPLQVFYPFQSSRLQARVMLLPTVIYINYRYTF